VTRKTIFDIYNEQHKQDVKAPKETNEVATTPTEEVQTHEEVNESKSNEVTNSTPLDDKGTLSLKEGENENGNGNISAQSVSA
jgi:hypothetical protein